MTLLNPRFTYDQVFREKINGKHYYVTPDGKLPSVTTILSATMPKGKQIALQKWKDKIGPGNARTILEMAASVGTQMHEHLEFYINGEPREPDEAIPFDIQGHYLADIVIENGIKSKVNEVWGTEKALYYPKLYAGTADCIGVHLGEPSLIDFKTSRNPKTRSYVADYFLQLAAYSMCHNEIFNTAIKKGVILMAVWDRDIPEYQEFVLDGEDFEEAKYNWAKRVGQYYEESA